MNNKYKVSIIVPCYQVAQYIETSVESMKSQHFEDFEIILVNDGTKDDSIERASAVLSDFDNIKVLDKENGGLPSARNAGLKVAQGKYVCFLDSDDVVSPNHLSSLYSLCEKNELIASFSLFESTNESNRLGTEIDLRETTILELDEFLWGFMDRRYKVHCCALLINRAYLIEHGICFNETLRYGEDIEFMWRLFPQLKKIGCTNMPTYKYLIRANSLMTSQNIDRVIIALGELCNVIDQNKVQYPGKKDLWELLPVRASLGFCHSFARASNYSSFKELKTRILPAGLWRFIRKYPYRASRLYAITALLPTKAFYYISRL